MRIPSLGRVAASALFLTLVAGCGRDHFVNQVDLPVSKQEGALALSEADNLRGLLNKGECQAIFHDAAFAGGSLFAKALAR